MNIETSQFLLKKGKYVKTFKSRLVGMFISIILLAYLGISTYLKARNTNLRNVPDINSIRTKKDVQMFFDYYIILISVITAVLKIIFGFILSLTKKSLFGYNHYILERILELVYNIVLLAIFSITLYNTISSFGFLREDLSFKPWDETSNILADIIINPRHHRRDLLALIATIAINIPLLIKVLVFAIKEFASLYLMVPLFIVGPILYLALIFSTSSKYEFSNYDDEYYLCTVTKKEGFLHFIKRFVLINSILALIGYIVYLMFTVGDDAFAHEVRHINGRDIHLVSIIVFIALNIVVVYITVLRIKLSSLRQKVSTQIYDRRNSRRIA